MGHNRQEMEMHGIWGMWPVKTFMKMDHIRQQLGQAVKSHVFVVSYFYDNPFLEQLVIDNSLCVCSAEILWSTTKLLEIQGQDGERRLRSNHEYKWVINTIVHFDCCWTDVLFVGCDSCMRSTSSFSCYHLVNRHSLLSVSQMWQPTGRIVKVMTDSFVMSTSCCLQAIDNFRSHKCSHEKNNCENSLLVKM